MQRPRPVLWRLPPPGLWLCGVRASLTAQMVKTLPAMQETVRFPRWEDPPEEGVEAHSSIPSWRIPWTQECGGLQSMGSQRVGQDWLSTHKVQEPFPASRPQGGADGL